MQGKFPSSNAVMATIMAAMTMTGLMTSAAEAQTSRPQARNTYEICGSDSDRACYKRIGTTSIGCSRQVTHLLHVFGDGGVDYVVKGEDRLGIVPVSKLAETALIGARAEMTPMANTGSRVKVKYAAINNSIHWECGNRSENQQLNAPMGTSAISIDIAPRQPLGGLRDNVHVFFYNYRSRDFAQGDPRAGYYVRRSESGLERCSKYQVRVFGKGNEEFAVARGQKLVIPLNFSTSVTQARWECGNYTENQQVAFPAGTDALLVHNVGDSGDKVRFTPLTWISYPHLLKTSTRRFENARWDGKRVDYCLHWGKECGRPAANAFCELAGYEQAVDFVSANNIGVPTKVLGDNRICNSPECDGFAHITCGNAQNYAREQREATTRRAAAMSQRNNVISRMARPQASSGQAQQSMTLAGSGAQTQTFTKASWNNYRLDYCLNWGKDCGKPAADAFCRHNRFNKAISFIIDPDIGDVTPTFVVGDKRVCDQKACDGFKKITCSN